MTNLKLHDEEGRLAALRRYQILDTSPEVQFDNITDIVKSVLSVPICAISLVDRDRQWLKSRQGPLGREGPRSEAFCAHTIMSNEHLLVCDAAADIRFSDNPLVIGPPFIRSYAGVPLQSPDGYNLGALCVIDTQSRRFSEAQKALLQNFAGLVVNELELRRIAERDHLTGAVTRRGFLQQMERAIARFEHYGVPSSLVLIDLDHFKTINDDHGHNAGDRVLKAVKACCDKIVRPSDVFGRLGGEEFALLLSETTTTSAMMVAERFRHALADLRLPAMPDVTVTASFGIAAIDHGRLAPDQWLAVADEALYRAKRSGRNRCVSYDRILNALAH